MSTDNDVLEFKPISKSNQKQTDPNNNPDDHHLWLQKRAVWTVGKENACLLINNTSKTIFVSVSNDENGVVERKADLTAKVAINPLEGGSGEVSHSKEYVFVPHQITFKCTIILNNSREITLNGNKNFMTISVQDSNTKRYNIYLQNKIVKKTGKYTLEDKDVTIPIGTADNPWHSISNNNDSNANNNNTNVDIKQPTNN